MHAPIKKTRAGFIKKSDSIEIEVYSAVVERHQGSIKAKEVAILFHTIHTWPRIKNSREYKRERERGGGARWRESRCFKKRRVMMTSPRMCTSPSPSNLKRALLFLPSFLRWFQAKFFQSPLQKSRDGGSFATRDVLYRNEWPTFWKRSFRK